MPVYDENSMLAMWPVYRESIKTLIEWPEKTSWTNMLDLVWNKNALHEPDSKDSQTAWRQEWTYHASVSGGNKFTGSGSIKFTKKWLLDKEPIEFDSSSAIKSLHVSYAKVNAEYSQMALTGVLGYLFYLLSFFGGDWLSETSNHHALFSTA